MPEITDDEYAELLALRESRAGAETIVVEPPEPAEMAAAEVAVIEARTESEIRLMEAATEQSIRRDEAAAELVREMEPEPAADEPESEPVGIDPRPESDHWFFRPITKGQR